MNIINKAEDLYSTINDVLDILSIDLDDLKNIYQQVSGQITVSAMLVGKRVARISLPKKAEKKFQKFGRKIESLPIVGTKVSETLGEYALALALGSLGFEPAHAGWRVQNTSGHGIDQIAYSEKNNQFIVAEAKGGSSRLRAGQMDHRWIKNHIFYVLNNNSGAMRDKLKAHHQFRPLIALVAKFQWGGAHQIKIEAQPYLIGNRPPMVSWQINNL